MTKFLGKFLLLVIGLAGVVGAIAWFLVADSLPDLDGERTLLGVADDVTIERDALGIATISAGNRIDLAFGTGFAHGQDRFFQMDLTRRNAAGELSALVGAAALPIDRRNRFHRFRARSNRVIDNLTDNERAVMEAYTQGVNAGLESLGTRPFEYLVLGATPEPWVLQDSLLAVYSMFLQLNDERAMRDVRRGLAYQVLPPEVFEWLHPPGTEWDAPLFGEALGGDLLPGAEVYDLRDMAPLESNATIHTDGRFLGSNNWAVSGALTESGRAIVANDMHLGIDVPGVWYRARMRTTDGAIDLNGVTLPGAPLLVAGSNGHTAWGYTNSYGDWSDAIVIKPGSEPDSYLTGAGQRYFETFVETIEVNGGEPEVLEIRETIWGPVLDDDPDPDRDFAINWIAHHPEALNLRHLQLETTRSVEDVLNVANAIGMPPQNFVTGDRDGNIGWTISGAIPVRTAFDSRVPADLSEGGGWTGWLPAAGYPRLVNPPSGRIWTANARVVAGRDLANLGDGGYALGARAQQIRDDLYARDTFSPQDMLGIQLDDRAVFMARWRDLLLALLDEQAIADDADRARYRQLAEDWVPRAASNSVGYRLVRAFRLDVRERVFRMLMQPVLARYGSDTELRMSNQFEAPLWNLVNERPVHLLGGGYASWRDLLLAAVDENIDFFHSNYSNGLEHRNWGERNTASIRHPLSGALSFASTWLDMPAVPLNGDSDLPRAQGTDWGASERFAVAPGLESEGFLHIPAGQSGHPMSGFYRAGHSEWVDGVPTPFLPGERVHRLVLKPDL